MSNIQKIDPKQIVIFSLDEPRYALYLAAVERVVQAVEITLLPVKRAPEFVQGVINFQGLVIPVLAIRKRLQLPRRDLDLNDLFIIAHTARRLVALVVDAVTGVHELTGQELVNIEQVLSGTEYIHGLVKLNDDLLLICDIDQFLSITDERILDKALSKDVIKTDRKKHRKTGEVE
jgi:purine-binding chemotaxis protein CheW